VEFGHRRHFCRRLLEYCLLLGGSVERAWVFECYVGGRLVPDCCVSVDSLAQSDPVVTDLQGPPSERTQSDKIRDLKSLAKQYARDQGSCDDTRISYLKYVESEAEADWTLARMIAG
jgi:hypothetical protein